jgi:hypothetical protein
MTEISDTELLKLVVATDDEILAKGIPPGPRMMHVIIEIMKKLGHVGFIFAGFGKDLSLIASLLPTGPCTGPRISRSAASTAASSCSGMCSRGSAFLMATEGW